jgi:hypothetical protein
VRTQTKVYIVLRDALAKSKKVVIGQLIMHGREHMVGITAHKKGLKFRGGCTSAMRRRADRVCAVWVSLSKQRVHRAAIAQPSAVSPRIASSISRLVKSTVS